MTTKDIIQEKFITQIVSDFKGINLISVRVGKCRVYLQSIQKHSENWIENPKILILYPNIDVKSSWRKECDIINYHPDITYCTYLSIDKVLDNNWDYIICDEAHLCGEEVQLPKLGELIRRHANTIVASGTYSNSTLESIKEHTGMSLTINYPTDKAIEDGIISDFNIIIYKFSLDSTTIKEFGKVKKWKSTELKECNRLSYKVANSFGKEKMFHALNRMRFINSCSSLIAAVHTWILNNRNTRFILFTGDENVGKNYRIPMYNSKSTDDSVLKAFQNEEINQICLIKKGKQGVTYPMLQHILITNIDSNGENLEQAIGRGLLNDTEDTTIHIFVSNQEFQLKWLNSALENIKPERITWKTI